MVVAAEELSWTVTPVGFALIEKSTTMMLTVAEWVRVPLVPVTVTK